MFTVPAEIEIWVIIPVLDASQFLIFQHQESQIFGKETSRRKQTKRIRYKQQFFLFEKDSSSSGSKLKQGLRNAIA